MSGQLCVLGMDAHEQENEIVQKNKRKFKSKLSKIQFIFFVLAFDIQHSRSYSEKLPRIVRCYDEEDIEQKLIRSETTA